MTVIWPMVGKWVSGRMVAPPAEIIIGTAGCIEKTTVPAPISACASFPPFVALRNTA
jgi:hypothetical protein